MNFSSVPEKFWKSILTHSLEKQPWTLEKHSNQFCTGQNPQFFCPLFIYGLRYVIASGVGGMQLTSQTYFSVLGYTLKMIKFVQSRYLQSVIACGALYKKAMIWNRVKLWTRLVSHRKHIIPVGSSENSGGGEGFESGTQAPHDCPCEQRPPSSLPWTSQRFMLPQCDE